MSLASREYFGRGEVDEIFVVGDDVNWRGGTLQIVSPRAKSLEDGEKLLIVRVVVQLGRGERTRVESDRVNLAVRADIRQYTCDRVVRSVGFDNYWCVGLIVCEDWRRCEGFLERAE